MASGVRCVPHAVRTAYRVVHPRWLPLLWCFRAHVEWRAYWQRTVVKNRQFWQRQSRPPTVRDRGTGRAYWQRTMVKRAWFRVRSGTSNGVPTGSALC